MPQSLHQRWDPFPNSLLPSLLHTLQQSFLHRFLVRPFPETCIMAQGLSKKRKEAPGSDRLSSHKHARGRPTQPDGHGQFEPVAHRTRSKSRLNHLDLQPTSLRVSPAKTSEGKNWNPIFSSSEGSSHAIEEQRGRATVRANDRERGHAGRTTIEQGEQSGSAIGRMTKAGGSPTRKPRSSHVEYVPLISSLISLPVWHCIPESSP